LFLDEVFELKETLQAKLLRVLEDGEVRRLGSRRTRAVSVRVVAAANRPLRRYVREGRFREDLFYRLNVLSLRLPPLRARREDIPLLFSHFLAVACESIGRSVPVLDEKAQEALLAYDWPGNVRELKNIALKVAVLADARVEPDLLASSFAETAADGAEAATVESPPDGATLKSIQQETERRILREALRRSGGNKAEAARLLGIHRATLYEKMRRYGLEA
jgi:DNA-binding NtrC family response regulator